MRVWDNLILVALDTVYFISLMPHNHKIYQKRIARPCKMLSHSWPSIFNSCLEYVTQNIEQFVLICIAILYGHTGWYMFLVHKTTYFWFEQYCYLCKWLSSFWEVSSINEKHLLFILLCNIIGLNNKENVSENITMQIKTLTYNMNLVLFLTFGCLLLGSNLWHQ